MTELLPHVAAFLSVAAPPRPWPTLTPDEARAQLAASARGDDGAPDIAKRDLAITRPDGSLLDVRIYGEATDATDATDATVLVFLHGGGWVYGDLDMADGFCRRLADAAGVVVCSVDYRLSPEHKFPLALHDACTAIEWAHEHLAGGVPIGVIGSSAGGNLAIAATIIDRDDSSGRIGLHIPMCAVTDHSFDTESYREHAVGKFLSADDMHWYWSHYLSDEADGSSPLVSVLRADLTGMPPALVVTAELDPLCDEGEEYARRLTDAGTPTTLVRHDGMIHAFPVLTAFPDEQARVITDVAAAVDAHLRLERSRR